MDTKTENSIRQEQVESTSRLMAGFSHDMKNHLGIIRESNGLMSDLIEMGGFSDDEILTKRLEKSISIIERRIVIAADMLRQLSCFAHRSDTPLSSFNINDLIAEEFTFLERFSRLKQINVTLEPGEGLFSIHNEPSLLQHVLYRLYVLCLEQLSTGHSLVIITRQNEKNTKIIFRLIGISQIYFENLFNKNMLAAVKKLEGTLEKGEKTKDYADIILAIPSLPIGK